MHKITPSGGGPIQQDGSVNPPGDLSYEKVSSVLVPASSAAILLDSAPDHHASGGVRLKSDDLQVSL